MRPFEQIEPLIQQLLDVSNEEDLIIILSDAARHLGFRHFALAHHVDVRRAQPHAIRIHNYPDPWVEYYERNALGVSDPVHRGAQRSILGFAWSELPRLVTLTRSDHDILARGEDMGIGDGFTVPAHVPGEIHGSCSFANPKGIPIPLDSLKSAQLVGAFGFEAARRLWRNRTQDRRPLILLTDRQREVVILIARGKSNWEIARILGIGQRTVGDHIKAACERYGVSTRTQLAVEALFDGSISFVDTMNG